MSDAQLVQHERPHSRSSEVGRQAHAVWEMEVTGTVQGQWFGGLMGGQRPQKWKYGAMSPEAE